ncbi:ATP-binding cassette domain-containing protein [Natrarchaeobius halalkaliphilus]|uniref:Molybdate/tungstate import ATP-binding protein WtpC n=1 Tax=Natrarchaeobius halalkaliphilus TaxID=1679091 RepID=A0A3N6NUS2_9EURY|nr:ATP-binding cassette domain-containing protein [Natrarchaeobius halalkaliphilus]RQG86950.1 ATP-binding cassette domain-containing protein [Natrarchaeobius halalkaliphilus]
MSHDTPNPTTSNSITFDGVTKIYNDGTEAVSDVSFSVPNGETATLVGPSGCGKTTTMKMVNALVEPTSGEVSVAGTSLTEYDPIELRRKVGYVIQDIGLFKHMTIEENVGIVPDIIGWDDDRIETRVTELLELVRLGDEVRTKYPPELSGGQQQRVGVARALAAEPDVMLMDEPFGALDPITREQLQDEFRRIQEGLDVTIVFVTHDIDEALKMGDRVAVMRDGELIQYDPPAELLRNPNDAFVESFLGEDRQLAQLQTVFVRDVMGPADEAPTADHVPTLSPDDTLRLAVQAWLRSDTDAVPVVESDAVVGSITETHLRHVFEESSRPIEENHV